MVVWWLKRHFSMQRVQVWSLVRELRSLASWSKDQNVKQKQYCNIINKDFFFFLKGDQDPDMQSRMTM